MPAVPYSLDGSSNEKDDWCPSLSWTQRIIGCAVCLGIGFFISILSFIVLFQRNYLMFGILNTLSNIAALASTCFLAGPLKQVKKMFAKTRIVATIVYLTTMVLTFIVALVLKIGWLTIICVIIQYLAMIWYTLSYIPFARDAIIRFVKGIFGGVVGGS